MKFNKLFILTLAVVSAVTLSACDSSSSKKKKTNVVCPTETFVEDGAAGSCIVSGTIDKDFTMTADTKWLLSGYVLVGSGNEEVESAADITALKDDGVTLTIEPGTDVRGLQGGVLVVTRGSKIDADGTAENPITFSSAQDDDYDGEAEWGGVVIQGFAPQYGPTGICGDQSTTFCNVEGEGGVGVYGGGDEDDDSGTIRYVRIAEGGLVVGAGNEINGLTLQGVGHGTTVEYVQVHGNRDDGVEWFGGTVNAKYLVLTNNDDDDIDFDEGYMGNIQYAIIRKNPTKEAPSGSNDPRGIEANSSGTDSVQETEAVLANISIIGSDLVTTGIEEYAMRLRGDVQLEIYNMAVKNYFGCYRIDDGQETATSVYLENFLCNGDQIDVDGGTLDDSGLVLNQSLTFDDAWAITQGAANVTAVDITAVDNGSDFEFDNTDYVGAVEPGTAAADAWWAGWTIEGSLDK